MAIGFRKSLFGFNASDVMAYIEAAQKTNAEKIAELTTENAQLGERTAEAEKKLEALSEENLRLSEQLNEYTEKYEEINRLSENIGKLYLVAQANAQAIIKNSADINERAAAEVEKNLSSIAQAQKSLNDIKQELLETTSDFSGRVSELIASLGDTKDKISDVNTDSEQRAADFRAIYETLDQ